MDEDMYPTDGEVFNVTTPDDVVESEAKEKALKNSPKELIGNMIDRMNARIDYYRGAEAYPEWSLQDKEGHWAQTLGNRQTIANLIIEKEYLETLLFED